MRSPTCLSGESIVLNSDPPVPGFKLRGPSQSALFNPRVIVALARCSCGVLLGMFSLAATPPGEAPRANTSLPPDPRNFSNTVGNNLNHLLPGVPLPSGTQFSLNRQGDPLNSSATARFPAVAQTPLGPSTPNGVNSLVNPAVANQQPARLSVQQPAAL